MDTRKRKIDVFMGVTSRVMRELKSFHKSQECSRFNLSFKDDDASRLILRLPSVSFNDTTNQDALNIYTDLEENGRRYGRDPEVVMEIVLDNYPTEPPFVYVVRPRFEFHTGHVTVGGSVCTELLTKQGWDPNMILETLVLILWQNFIEGKARVVNFSIYPHFEPEADYSEKEARQAFTRSVDFHRSRGDWK